MCFVHLRPRLAFAYYLCGAVQSRNCSTPVNKLKSCLKFKKINGPLQGMAQIRAPHSNPRWDRLCDRAIYRYSTSPFRATPRVCAASLRTTFLGTRGLVSHLTDQFSKRLSYLIIHRTRHTIARPYATQKVPPVPQTSYYQASRSSLVNTWFLFAENNPRYSPSYGNL